MPAVAQISVDFARTSEIVSNNTTPPTNVKSVNPLTLTRYLLYNRELPNDNNGINTPSNLSYQGGFITAGDRINVKHNDLQLLQNIEVGRYVQTEFIVSRNRENGTDNYLNVRQNNTRSVTIAPRPSDHAPASIDNVFVTIGTEPNRNFIDLYTKRTATESYIRISNTSSDVSIVSRTTLYSLSASTTNITSGQTNHTGPVTISGVTTINNNTNISGDVNVGTSSYNKFNIIGSTGEVKFEGDLKIKTNQFTVESDNGNTETKGSLKVGTTSTFVGTITANNSLTFNVGNENAETRRITGVRRVVNSNLNTDIYSATRETDALTIGDFVDRFYNIPRSESSSFTIRESDSQATILVNSPNAVSVTIPSGMRTGVQVSVIRRGSGAVQFVAGSGVTLFSAPTNFFTKLAFQNSVATCYHAGGNQWYLFGDLLP